MIAEFADKMKSKKFSLKLFIIAAINLTLFLGLLRISIYPACWDFEPTFKFVSFFFTKPELLLKICNDTGRIIFRPVVEGIIILVIVLIISIIYLKKSKE